MWKLLDSRWLYPLLYTLWRGSLDRFSKEKDGFFPQLMGSFPDGKLIFMQDAPCHESRYVMIFLAEIQLHIIHQIFTSYFNFFVTLSYLYQFSSGSVYFLIIFLSIAHIFSTILRYIYYRPGFLTGSTIMHKN